MRVATMIGFYSLLLAQNNTDHFAHCLGNSWVMRGCDCNWGACSYIPSTECLCYSNCGNQGYCIPDVASQSMSLSDLRTKEGCPTSYGKRNLSVCVYNQWNTKGIYWAILDKTTLPDGARVEKGYMAKNIEEFWVCRNAGPTAEEVAEKKLNGSLCMCDAGSCRYLTPLNPCHCFVPFDRLEGCPYKGYLTFRGRAIGVMESAQQTVFSGGIFRKCMFSTPESAAFGPLMSDERVPYNITAVPDQSATASHDQKAELGEAPGLVQAQRKPGWSFSVTKIPGAEPSPTSKALSNGPMIPGLPLLVAASVLAGLLCVAIIALGLASALIRRLQIKESLTTPHLRPYEFVSPPD
jgi:hypothetical protein